MLLNYLVYHGFSSVSVSAGPDSTLWDKTSNFFTLAAKQGLYTELLVGDNNLIFPEREQELKSVIQKASDLGAKAVHLDVEPHTFDDWENREEFYLARYVDMLNKADSLTQLRGLQLSVSVPHYYEDIIVEIDSLTTSITFMVYEVTDTETLIERMNKELKVTGPDIEIALRPEDFRTIPELNAFVREIRSATGIARFRIHDLGSMLTIDKVELEGN